MNTQLAELVEGAFDYHPFGWNRPKPVGDYAIGPTFMAWCPEFAPKQRTPIYTEISANGYEEAMAESILRHSPDPDPEISVSKDAHKRHRTKENCKARCLMMGEYEMDIELGYPLYRLMRFYKPTKFALENEILYAWDDERMVFAAKTRPRAGYCKEPADVQD